MGQTGNGSDPFGSVVARSPQMARTVEQARRVAASPSTTVLLLGESGTGKGLLARAIHRASARAGAPFLTVTCSAIPEHLLEAELFGHERGAFTDARERRAGLLESAQGGTVFLDEVGDMPLPLQAKLLGVLEERRFRRLGGTHPIEINVRMVAATHRDLDRLVAERVFREDLLYRLKVVPVVIEPLRDRAEDILVLARAYVRQFSVDFGHPVQGLDERAEARLLAHPWPGNVRELRNVIERAVLFARRNEWLTGADLEIDRCRYPSGPSAVASSRPLFELPPEGIRLDELERDLVRQAMARAKGVKSLAAKILGISRDQIRYRLQKHG